MQISVIVPLNSWSDFAPRAVKSVLVSEKGETQNWDSECILVTNSEEHAEKVRTSIDDPRLKIVVHPFSTDGEAANLGLARAKGEWIGVLSPNDMLMAGWQAHVQNTICSNPQVDLVYSAGVEIDANDVTFRNRKSRAPSKRNLQSRLTVVSDAVFYRKTLFDRFGTFDARLVHRFEFEYLLRLALQNTPFAEIQPTIVGIRILIRNRRASPEEIERMLQQSEEAIAVLRSKQLEPGDRGLLYRGALEADQAGLTRLTGVAFDRCVLQSALKALDNNGHDRPAKARVAIRMALTHARVESNFLLKRPRLATRFLPQFLRTALTTGKHRTNSGGESEERPSHRIFQLRYDDPHPCKLPGNYFQSPASGQKLSISIVTPNLNQGPFIERTIKSVLSQDYPNLEYVVQDGCSKDESIEVIRRYESQISHWQSIKDRGQSHAINLGLERTSGDIMAYLNSDDILMPGSLAYVADYFDRHPDVDVVYGNRVLIDEQDNVINYWVLPSHDHEAIAWADFVPQETMFWRRSAWDAIGSCVDDSFHFAMDWDMILRFRSAGMRFVHLPRFLGAFRITDGQKTKQLLATVGLKEMSRLRQRELGYVPSEIEVSKRMGPYVKRQWYAERKFELTNYMAHALTGTRTWSPDDWTPSAKRTLLAA